MSRNPQGEGAKENEFAEMSVQIFTSRFPETSRNGPNREGPLPVFPVSPLGERETGRASGRGKPEYVIFNELVNEQIFTRR